MNKALKAAEAEKLRVIRELDGQIEVDIRKEIASELKGEAKLKMVNSFLM
jgi:hypothetical protein